MLAEVIVLARAEAPCFRRFWRSKSHAVLTFKTDTHVDQMDLIVCTFHVVTNQGVIISQAVFI